MKVLLNICGVGFIAKDAASAAKVADLLSAMQPVSREWLGGNSMLVQGREQHRGLVEITELGDCTAVDRKKFEAMKQDGRELAERAGAKGKKGGAK